MLERKSNFELLRIVSMTMIIVAHYCYYGGALFHGTDFNHTIATFLKTGGKLGVTCFVLITGFFMCEKNFRFSSFFKVILQTLFYSTICFLLFAVVEDSFSIKIFVKTILSPIYGNYWFVTAYLTMYLLIPFLNVIHEKMEISGTPQKILFILGILFSIIPFTFFIPGIDNVRWFCFLYLVGAFCKKHPINKKHKTVLLSVFLGSVFLIWASVWGITAILDVANIGRDASKCYYFSKLNSPLMFSAGLSLFLLFENVSVTSKKINYVAKLSFAAYLLHDNNIFRDHMWHDLLQTESFIDKPIYLFLSHIILCITLFWGTAFVLEQVRRPLENFIFSRKLISNIDSSINKIMIF